MARGQGTRRQRAAVIHSELHPGEIPVTRAGGVFADQHVTVLRENEHAVSPRDRIEGERRELALQGTATGMRRFGQTTRPRNELAFPGLRGHECALRNDRVCAKPPGGERRDADRKRPRRQLQLRGRGGGHIR
jgi:hypothetical protein